MANLSLSGTSVQEQRLVRIQQSFKQESRSLVPRWNLFVEAVAGEAIAKVGRSQSFLPMTFSLALGSLLGGLGQ